MNDRNRPTITVREVESCWGKEVNRSEDTPPVTGDFRLWMQTSWVSTGQLEEDDFSVENGELLLLRYGGEGVIWCASFEPAADGEVKIVIRKGAFGSEALPSVRENDTDSRRFTPDHFHRQRRRAPGTRAVRSIYLVRRRGDRPDGGRNQGHQRDRLEPGGGQRWGQARREQVHRPNHPPQDRPGDH